MGVVCVCVLYLYENQVDLYTFIEKICLLEEDILDGPQFFTGLEGLLISDYGADISVDPFKRRLPETMSPRSAQLHLNLNTNQQSDQAFESHSVPLLRHLKQPFFSHD